MPLNPEDINPGRTYEGADGERRCVYVITEAKPRPVGGPWVAWYRPEEIENKFATPEAFAAWAVREVCAYDCTEGRVRFSCPVHGGYATRIPMRLRREERDDG